jgi:hypothetical protein
MEEEYKTRLDRVIMEPTTRCNLRCPNCNMATWRAPNRKDMTLDQIEKFVWQTKECDWYWREIALGGGEPTLHPQLLEMIVLLKPVGKHIKIVSNGYSDQTNRILGQAKRLGAITRRSVKSPPTPEDPLGKYKYFFPFQCAPIDMGMNANWTKGCLTATQCGIGFNRHGYYCCGPARSIDRVFGFDIAIKNLSDATQKRFDKQKNIMCRICGHFFSKNQKKRVDRELMSESWKEAYEKYAEEQPQLTLF